MRSKMILLTAAIFIGLLFLPGCLTFTIDTRLNPDGSGQRSLDIAIDQSFADILETKARESEELSLEETLKKDLPKGTDFRKFSREGKVHYETTFLFENIDELNQINRDLTKNGSGQRPASEKITLDKKDWLFFVNYRYFEKFTASQTTSSTQKQLVQPFTAVYKLSLPGKITKANAEKVKRNSATWYINPLKGGEIKASSFYIRWWTIILAVSLILVLMGGSIYFIRQRSIRSKKVEIVSTSKNS